MRHMMPPRFDQKLSEQSWQFRDGPRRKHCDRGLESLRNLECRQDAGYRNRATSRGRDGKRHIDMAHLVAKSNCTTDKPAEGDDVLKGWGPLARCPAMSDIGGKAEIICSFRVFRIPRANRGFVRFPTNKHCWTNRLLTAGHCSRIEY
jgi:hypothetical protein